MALPRGLPYGMWAFYYLAPGTFIGTWGHAKYVPLDLARDTGACRGLWPWGPSSQYGGMLLPNIEGLPRNMRHLCAGTWEH